MPDSNRCPQCQALLPSDAPRGLCPECLLKLGLQSGPSVAPGSGTAPTTPLSGRFTPPSIEELAPKFPQLDILELLGQGGMGAVYKARQPKLNRLVALKVLPRELGDDPNFTERFTREAQALAALNHPHIVAVYDFGQAEGLCYFLMEFVDGVNLRETLRAGQLVPAEALRIVPQVCEALQYAHNEGIVHRDIKPENILLDRRGRVKIADFGLAKLVSRPESEAQLTMTHQVMGTPHYMAPEQIEHPTEVDHRADIFSLGVVFYEMLTGQLPLGRFAPPSEKVQIDVRLDDVVLRTLAREPERRYQHASEVKTAVENVASRTDFPPDPPKAAIATVPDARLSRAALWGAIWAPFALILPVLLIAILIPTYSHVESRQEAVAVNSNTGAIRVETVPPAANTRPPQAAMPLTPQEAMMPMWFGILCAIVTLPIGLLGFSAPFGTTILGMVAIGKIRRSQGKLYGLPLAVMDALLFPLLLIDLLIVGMLLVGYRLTSGSNAYLLFAILAGIGIAAAIDFVIVRGVWRNVTRTE